MPRPVQRSPSFIDHGRLLLLTICISGAKTPNRVSSATVRVSDELTDRSSIGTFVCSPTIVPKRSRSIWSGLARRSKKGALRAGATVSATTSGTAGLTTVSGATCALAANGAANRPKSSRILMRTFEYNTL